MRLIDADALKKQIEDFHCKDCNNYNFVRCRACHIDDAISYLDEAPTIGGWISVKDRLPGDEGDVLVYGASPRGRKKVAIMNYLAFEADRPRWALDGIWTVLYWMPIPEPPKGDYNG